MRHGSCCTCQACGKDYDDCRCDLDDVAEKLDAARARIVELEESQKKLRSFVAWCFDQGVIEGGDIDGGMLQDEMELRGFIERRRVDPGSPEAGAWGEDAELYYLKDEFRGEEQ